MAGWEEAAGSGSGFEVVAVVGLEAVAVHAEPVEVAELGDLDRGPVDAVIDLEVAGGGAAAAGALATEPVEHDLL